MDFEVKYNRKPIKEDTNILYEMIKELIQKRLKKEGGIEIEIERKYIDEM